MPFPESQTLEVLLDRPAAIARLRDVLVADSFPIARVDLRDTWLETPWFDRGTFRAVRGRPIGRQDVKLRAWADPARPGSSMLVLELSWRPTADAALPPRLLERPVPSDDPVARQLKVILDSLAAEVGTPSGNGSSH